MSGVTHHAKYLVPGSFLAEAYYQDLESRSVDEAIACAPRGAYCFTIYDKPVPNFPVPDGFRLVAEKTNETPNHYIGGKVYTLAEVERMGDDKRILAANMRSNDCPKVIQSPGGNWSPFSKGDALVEVKR